jgi:hypothetical protein
MISGMVAVVGPAVRVAMTTVSVAQVDSATVHGDSLSGRFVDSVVVKSPLPDPLVPFVQWIFQQPGWVMQGGIVLGAFVAVAACLLLWRRRRAIRTWLVTRDRGAKLAMLGGVGVVLAAMVFTGVKAQHYMMHDNDFCRGCHIFVPSGQVFVRPDTGTYLLVNRLEGKHDTLSCHACHPFELKAQTKELVYWILERPDKIPPHAKVPRRICESCHVQGAAKHTWARIASTAGHRTHLESDSSALKDVACLTCHARTAHRFQPADTTCAQQGCHLTDDVQIRLGRMAARFDKGAPPIPNEEQLYCNACHQFTAEAQFVSPDSATGLLRPGSRQCFGCHEMRTLLLAKFDPARDPHGGSCGTCHNPHTDVKPAAALKSCAGAQCHADWRKVDFHTGASHRGVAERCETCHIPHQARVDASNCVGCHERVRSNKAGHLRPPLPFDTTKALKQTSRRSPSRLVEPGRALGRGGGPPDDEAAGGGRFASAAPSDSFSHPRHRRLACITCHDPASKTRRLTFVPPRGCQICHHQHPTAADCATCHAAGELEQAEPVQVAVEVKGHEPRHRTVEFAHASHAELACTGCHLTPVTLAPSDSVLSCSACHVDHHAVGRTCATCHRTAETLSAHRPLLRVHAACDACHEPSTVARLAPSRAFCLACHEPARDHYPERECSTCHFQRSPGELRPTLQGHGPS